MKVNETYLDIASSALTLLEPDGANKAAVIFPGAGYTCDRPLLYYITDILLHKGYRVALAEHNWSRDKAWLAAGDGEKIAVVREYGQVVMNAVAPLWPGAYTLIGKSLGTIALANILRSNRYDTSQVLWLTPALRGDWKAMTECHDRNLAVIGTADQRYEECRDHLPEGSIVVPDADHSMEISGSTTKSIQVLASVVARIEAWLF